MEKNLQLMLLILIHIIIISSCAMLRQDMSNFIKKDSIIINDLMITITDESTHNVTTEGTKYTEIRFKIHVKNIGSIHKQYWLASADFVDYTNKKHKIDSPYDFEDYGFATEIIAPNQINTHRAILAFEVREFDFTEEELRLVEYSIEEYIKNVDTG